MTFRGLFMMSGCLLVMPGNVLIMKLVWRLVGHGLLLAMFDDDGRESRI
jgi:hypothetical protein